ncbi:MAG: bifunctional diaminohydroxyphosphoribosylaminopyrimidine deaminase/5-amino-6-(5-phosphoribosylamino)uracil reductase RibD [Alphaproteobacteria bacterium]|nr:bifunctional diaminohydroxyphosphoribosylaminopyrimidine deaminase/5-amino-6-(5-phosphoribosylamino)uracil reductase RibD [Alphaproteobacteria bacterium]
MDAALALARRGLGNTWPNPAVGCVIVKDGIVVGRGWTQAGGRPHAETEALARAGSAAKGATVYVTLEPCSHHGKTPPCADALIAAQVARVVVATGDPDTRVDGRGIAMLRAAGIAVEQGLCKAEADALNAGFFKRVREGKPLVTLKLAGSLDMRIATKTGESKWITGDASRARAHLIRAQHDAIMVGSGTVLADDPSLDVRLPGFDNSRKVRVVVDGRLRTPLTAKLVRTARTQPSWIVHRPDPEKLRAAAFAESGVEMLALEPGPEGHATPDALLKALAAKGITRLMIEGGAQLAGAFLRADAVDRLSIFRAGRVIGDGVPAIAAFGVAELANAPGFRLETLEKIGDDTLETWTRDH